MATIEEINQWVEQAKGGMSDERLREVFDLVKPRPNWKMPIAAIVSKDDATRQEIETAVTWFAGGLPDVTEIESSRKWRVSGAGYYEWIGA